MSRRQNPEARDNILEAAHRLIYKSGFKGVSMDDIATASGIKKANLFHYYPTKEALGLAVFDFAVRGVQEQMGSLYASDDVEPNQLIEKMFDGAAQGMEKSGCSGGCFVGNMAQELSDYNENLRHKVASYMHLWSQRLADYLDRWRTKGFFEASFSPSEAALGILSLFEGAMLLAKSTRNVEVLAHSKQLALRYLDASKA